MTRPRLVHSIAAAATAIVLLWGSSASSVQASALPAPEALNPCAAKTLNPCNPCGMGNPCNPCGGGAHINPCQFKRPSGLSLLTASHTDLLAEGEKLWNDRTLGKSGLACANCHIQSYMQMNPSFGTPFPHAVEMVKQRSGVDEVSADEMVQFCMMAPMASQPLDWHSRELAALTTYVEHLQPGYHAIGGAGANPCNPCSMKHNPCNPCGMKHNPCNPCGMKRNPCNPCSQRK